MTNITEIAITFIIIFIGDKIQENYKPKELEMYLSNGKISYVKINKKDYSCPKSCKANHFHEVTVSNKNTNQYNYQIHYDSFDSNLKLNELDIINIYEIKNKKSKKDKDIQTKKEKIEVNYFIDKFNL